MALGTTWCFTVANVTVTVTGEQALQATVRAIQAGVPEAVGQALRAFAENVIGDAKEQYVPIRTGALNASGFVRQEQPLEVTLGFGGAAAPYAIAVHENPRAGRTGGVSPSGQPYTRYARNGEWKYLETPLKLHSPQMGQALRVALDALAKESRA